MSGSVGVVFWAFFGVSSFGFGLVGSVWLCSVLSGALLG